MTEIVDKKKLKIAIIYRGNIRGFKYEECFKTHKKMYEDLKQANIDFDVHLCTNNYEYDDNNVEKIINLKSKHILDIETIRANKSYLEAYSNINFTTNGWSDNYHNNLITYWYNNNYLYDNITNKYDKYIILDIAHIIYELDINLLLSNDNFVSQYESSSGYNDRIIIANYEVYKIVMTHFTFAINNKLTFINPEQMFLTLVKDYNIIKTEKIKICRIRWDRSIVFTEKVTSKQEIMKNSRFNKNFWKMF